MSAYRNADEYWCIVEQRYQGFARPEDRVKVVDSYYRPGGLCQLCDHEISNHFVIKNMRSQKTMVVGSRCIQNRVKIEKKWRDQIRGQREQALGQRTVVRDRDKVPIAPKQSQGIKK